MKARSSLMIVTALAVFASGAVLAEGIRPCPVPLRAEGISPILKRPLVQVADCPECRPMPRPLRTDIDRPWKKPLLLACQQKLCPGPKKPLVQVADISPWVPRPLSQRPAIALA